MQFFHLILILWVELAVAKSDSNALLDFRRGIQTDPSGLILGSWDASKLESDQCPTSWFGIQCSEGHVISITLDGLGLTGTLDFSALAGLRTLRNLSVSNNNLLGTLPSELGSVVSLEYLDLSDNSFHGSIPTDLVNLKNLIYLNFSANNLSGPVPANFGRLQQLKCCDLHSNDLSGNVGELVNQLQSVLYLDLSSNKFTGGLDFGLRNSTFVQSVQYLNISNNGLSGELFGVGEMPLFDSLEVFDASYNQLSGQVPPFNFIVSLQILLLRNNQFSGYLPESLLLESSMVLTELDVSCNQLQGPMRSITSTTLKSLNLSSNKLSGSLPAKIGHVAIVDLSNNMLSGNLSSIRSWGNYAEQIHLSSNSLTGTFPNETSQFLRLNSIKISNNSLQGALPLVLGTYPQLSTIDLSLNKLSGLLLPNLFASLRLSYLNLSFNHFVGTNPLPILTQNSSLESLDLSHNLLSGSLSSNIGTMDQLKLLDLGNNNISGHIPGEIGKLHNLACLDLSNNQLEGPIPNNLPNALQCLNVSYNNLSGVVPDNLLKFPESSFYPGNSLLILPRGPSKGGSGNFFGRNKGMKSAQKAALIAAFVGGTALVTLFLILICYLARCRIYSGGASARRNVENKDLTQGMSLPDPVGVQKTHKALAASSSFYQDPLSPKPKSPSERDNITLGPANVESTMQPGFYVKPHSSETSPPKDTGFSPMPTFSMSKSRSTGQRMPDHAVVLNVCSPDRLAGDLHLFDNYSVFSAEELSGAPAEVIGRSCHGTTYRATLGSGHVLTVKWLREGIAKSKKEFAREAKKLGNIKHQNIVSFRGYYWGPKEHERLLISDYIQAKALSVHLYGAESGEFHPLSISQRLKVAIDVACALSYLHNERAIPHGNLKSANVLIEWPQLNTYLTDYSLHRLLNPAGTAEQVLNSGALGYCPPEFASTSKPCPSLKSDIYAFGVILLEILTGRCAGEIVSGNTGVVDLTDWVKLLANGNRSLECFDRSIPGLEDGAEQPPKGLEEMLNVSLRCILPASERPDIRTIFEDLSSIVL